MPHQVNSFYEPIIKHSSHLNTVQHCATTCEHMITILHNGHNMHHRTMQLQYLRDCADICELVVKYLSRESHLSKTLAQFCAYVCELCAEACLKFPDVESQHCGHVCLHCAKMCREFAAITI